MTNTEQRLVFHLADRRYALPVTAVARVLRMVEVTPLTEPRPPICGVINFQGRILPVIDTRELFHLPSREAELEDQLILVHGPAGQAIFWVDPGVQVRAIPTEQLTPGENLPPQMGSVSGVFRDPEGMIMLQNVDRLMSGLAGWSEHPSPVSPNNP